MREQVKRASSSGNGRGDAGELSHFFHFRQYFCKFASWMEMFVDTVADPRGRNRRPPPP